MYDKYFLFTVGSVVILVQVFCVGLAFADGNVDIADEFLDLGEGPGKEFTAAHAATFKDQDPLLFFKKDKKIDGKYADQNPKSQVESIKTRRRRYTDTMDPRAQPVRSSYAYVQSSSQEHDSNPEGSYGHYRYSDIAPEVPSKAAHRRRADDSKRKPFRFPEDNRRDDFGIGENVDSTLRNVGMDPTVPKVKARTGPSSRGHSRQSTKSEPYKAAETSNHKPAPKNIKEVIGPANLEESASDTSGDLKKEGSYGSPIGEYGGAGFDKEKHFEKDGGKKFVQAHKAQGGEKEEKGYKKEEVFDKGLAEKHGHEEKKAEISEKGGEKQGHIDQSKHYGEAHKANEGEKAFSVVKKGGHKKGKKTSGFHKVHHKDEYKKDEVFFDESHDGGEHEESAHEQEKHANEKGGSAKKGHIDSSYHEHHGNKKGEQDHGKHYKEEKGHQKEAGHSGHHDEQSEYAKKAGVEEGEKYGHADVGGHGYYGGSDW
ncbi:hypothetical protein M8J76_007426 [Diaphorina citri]|nr:hypothetical protein M8J76_007426 [Diaphorina citri]